MKLIENIDYYIDERSGLMVLTAHVHLTRGFCCGNGCRECPYFPKNVKGNKNLTESNN
jgi:hypothetical protein